MTTIRTLIIALSCVLCLAAAERTACENQYTYRIQQKDAGKSNAIFLSISKGVSFTNGRVILYDLRKGKAVAEKTVSLSITSESKVFEKVPSSLYTVYVGAPGCEMVGIGGYQGIKID